MKNNCMEMVFILDRSGSMVGLEKDTNGGFNAMLDKQKAAEAEALVTTVLFDDRYELLHDRIDLRAVAPVTEMEYYVRGSTALLDAVGETIKKIARAQKTPRPITGRTRWWLSSLPMAWRMRVAGTATAMSKG